MEHPLLPNSLQARRGLLLAGVGAWLTGCAALRGGDALKVNLVGVDALPGEGLELRFMAGLRLQNPSEQRLEFDGIALDLDLRDLPFASGVSAQRGTLPRFSEMVIGVPVTVPASAVLRQGYSLLRGGGEVGRISYALRGRLGGGLMGVARFQASGDIDWPPTGPAAPAAPARTPGAGRL